MMVAHDRDADMAKARIHSEVMAALEQDVKAARDAIRFELGQIGAMADGGLFPEPDVAGRRIDAASGAVDGRLTRAYRRLAGHAAGPEEEAGLLAGMHAGRRELRRALASLERARWKSEALLAAGGGRQVAVFKAVFRSEDPNSLSALYMTH